MNEKLKEFAAQAGFNLSWDYHCDEDELERFAEFVRQDERIACADLVFEMVQMPKYENVWSSLHQAQAAIRERQSK